MQIQVPRTAAGRRAEHAGGAGRVKQLLLPAILVIVPLEELRPAALEARIDADQANAAPR